jgi:hypothetical protein
MGASEHLRPLALQERKNRAPTMISVNRLKNVRLGSAAYRGRPAKDTSRRAEDEMDDPGGSTLGKIGGLLAPDDLYLAYFAQRNRA